MVPSGVAMVWALLPLTGRAAPVRAAADAVTDALVVLVGDGAVRGGHGLGTLAAHRPRRPRPSRRPCCY